MSSVDQIQHAIDQLSREEFLVLLDPRIQFQRSVRLHAREEQELDAQMDHDASAGRLDFLRNEARSERSTGIVREWPERERSI